MVIDRPVVFALLAATIAAEHSLPFLAEIRFKDSNYKVLQLKYWTR